MLYYNMRSNLYKSVSFKEACSLRRRFISKFADKNLPQYRSVMGYGDFYGTSEWHISLREVLRPCNLISRESALGLVSGYPELYVMWERPLGNTSRNLQKSRMLKLSGTALADTLKTPNLPQELSFLPKDIYVFSNESDFYIAFTDDYIKGIGGICVTSLSNTDDRINDLLELICDCE